MLKYSTWTTEKNNGSFLRRTYYNDPNTGKKKIISVTLTKNTPQSIKAADMTLEQRIQAIYDKYEQESDDSPHLTLKSLLDKYIAYQRATGIQENTLARNRITNTSIIKILGENTEPPALTAGFIVSALTATDISNGTRNNYLTRFKAFMRWAYSNDFIEDIRFLDKIRPFPEMTAREKIVDKYLEPAELQELLDNMHVEKWELLTRFLVLSGLRIGEAIALNDSDVTSDTIRVNKTMDVNKKSRKDRTKTDSSTRLVDVQPDLAAVIAKIRRYVRLDKVRNGYRSSLFFPGEDGDFIHYDAYRKYLKETAAPIITRTKVTPHTLRHTHVSMLAAQGVSFDTISRRVGHEGSDITKKVYFHVTSELRERDREQLMKVHLL